MSGWSSAVRGVFVLDEGVLPGVVTIADGVITAVSPRARATIAPGGVRAFAPDHIIVPGLVDLHCHGGGGVEFGACVDDTDLRRAVEHHRRAGATTLVASLVSNTPEALVEGSRACAALVAQRVLAGIHLEGPFLSMERRGAQNPAVLTDVVPRLVEDVAQTCADAGAPDALVQMTYAPERDPDGTLPSRLAAVGALPAVGHTDADAATTRAALHDPACAGVRGGTPLVTHVFNGMPPMHHRDPGPVAAALAAAAQGRAVLEVIADGHHLDGETIRFLFDSVGADQIALVTDAMSACGMPEGTYRLGGQEVCLADGAARLVEGGSLAGSVATLAQCLRVALRAGVPLPDAVRAATATPARVLGRDDVGRIAVGRSADLLVLDPDLQVAAVMHRGAWLDLG